MIKVVEYNKCENFGMFLYISIVEDSYKDVINCWMP